MSPADLLGGAILAALVLYALLGGADFGGGIWDLLATGPRRKAQRDLVEQAIGPIWEANHVWLILVIVLLFTCFPSAFAAISIALFVPLVLLLFGIVLRGAAFTFRTYDRPEDKVQVRWGLVFSSSSVLAPVVLGVVVGAIASGRLAGPPEGVDPLAWLSPFPLSVGLFAAALFAFLAASYLAVEAKGELQEDFRRRAIGAGGVVFGAAVLAGVLSWFDAPLVFAGLTRRGFSLPLHAATALAAVTAFAALFRRRYRLARAAAAAQVTLIVLGWGASQYPYLVVPGLTLADASAPRATQVAVLWALAAGAVFLFPALYLLFRVFKGERPLSVVDRATPGAGVGDRPRARGDV
ncbi:cytochrome d ubiquinol oxidase subunit II [Anaeromyxobacter sp. Fw109-5]|uniref:cytochrome d ubiquinol oxidase subunit II n=1 Tax=Anaeromyxobacter sp. (strain Fw109-5) TaxID=404589 RepID=UPI000158A78B|nr:cytochrome d ubiquinol oxidase subunit II [Anaeromyxobacter sp. Fw109-5]ABS25191.1 cytochrome bd ubiquinol oxidase subunit II [Anaeromyxobacter sp. Fw109-5]